MKFVIELVQGYEEDDAEYTLIPEGEWPKTKAAALKASIAKWQALVDFHAEYGHAWVAGVMGESCALCNVFNSTDPDNDNPGNCDGCPVLEKTGRRECANTPFWEYYNHRSEFNARAELDFLKSLE